MNRFLAALAALVLFSPGGSARAAELPPAGAFRTPVTADGLDAAAYAEWADGAERAIAPTDAKDSAAAPKWVVWTDRTTPGHSGYTFGASNAPGPRHLRIGFKTAVPVGAVLVRGGVRVAVLKPDAAYPGNLADDAQWLPAQRIKDGRVSGDEAATRDSYVLWTLPQAVATRAVRFSHDAAVTDKDYAGHLGGAYVLPARVVNLATQATPVTSANDRDARALVDESYSPNAEQWSNILLKGGERPRAVSADSPEWVMLTWAAPVKLRGLAAVFAGFAEAEVQSYAGPADVHPREAPESAWQTVKTFTGLKNQYPVTLGVDFLDFGRDVTTRAVRLRITKPLAEGGHPHTLGHTKNGQRVWLGELIALQPLAGDADLKTAVLPTPEEREHPPIAVKFTLPEAGWVTLVIEDATGHRVRNLVADTFFERGENTAWWDGSDDLGRDPTAAQHGLYYIPTQLVAPGGYRVRGLWRKQVDVKYEFGLYTAGTTPWETADRSGGWLANHTPPSATLFVPNAPDGKGGYRPAVLIGSYVSEGTAGLAWVDLDGKKWRGQGWVGGNWTGAPYLARDAGAKAIPGVYAYVAAAWDAGDPKDKKSPKQGEIRVTGLTDGEDRPIVKYLFTPASDDGAEKDALWEQQIGGVAAHDGTVVVSLPALNRLVFIDAAAKRVVGEAALDTPRGLAFDAQGRLFAASGKRVVRFATTVNPANLPTSEVAADGLDEPNGVTLDASGNLYVADRGRSHQIKVFSPEGKLVRAIGKPGEPKAGPYDPQHMNNPRGVTIDSQGRLWVAEVDAKPKRVSVWNADGSLAHAFYGPSEYGGGGSLDPQDKTRFYYNGMEFKLDWEKGTDQLASVFYRPLLGDLKLAFRDGPPQTAIYVQGRRYWTNAFNSNPTGGHGTAFVFADRGGFAVPVAAAGRANEWDALKAGALASAWPAGTDPAANPHTPKAAFFVWHDLNADGQVQANELALQKGVSGGVTVMRDLSFVVARLEGKAVRFAPQSFTSKGVPIYDAAKAQVLADGVQSPPSSGGDQAIVAPDGGWTVLTTAPKPYAPSGFAGVKDGQALWSYPSLWPGLHASHEAPVPDRPGMVVGHTRLLGDFITPGADGKERAASAAGERMWLLNGNTGMISVFTADGLLVTQLFRDMRVGRPWGMPTARRGMVLNDLTPGDENFWPSVTQTPDGAVYLVAGGKNCLARVDGLETVRRLAASDVAVTPADLDRCREHYARAEAARQAARGRGVLTVALRGGDATPKVDGNLDDWKAADWADVDKRGTAAYFNSKSGAYDVTAAVAVAGDRLYAAWRTGDKDLLRNAGDVPNAPFKTGGALDLMVGADPAADPKRTAPAAGDVRLLVTRVGGKTRALIYRPVAPPGVDRQPVPFASPGRTITFDRVDDVSEQVQLASSADGDYELSVPLAVFGLKPTAGQTIRGDVGILRGTGSATTQRVYWSNKATAIVADVPSEAELRPNLWGRWEFKPAGSK